MLRGFGLLPTAFRLAFHCFNTMFTTEAGLRYCDVELAAALFGVDVLIGGGEFDRARDRDRDRESLCCNFL